MSELTEAAARRAEAAEQRRDNYIAALEDERRGYVQRENSARIEQVDRQIAWAKTARFNAAGPAEASPDAEATAAKVAAAPPTEPAATEPAAATPAAKPAASKPAASKPAAKPAAKKAPAKPAASKPAAAGE